MSSLTLPLSLGTSPIPESMVELVNTSVYQEESSLVSEASRLIQLLHQSSLDDSHISFYLGVSATWSPWHGDEAPTTFRIREVYNLVKQVVQSSNFDILGFPVSPETDNHLRPRLLSIGNFSRAVRVPVYRLPNEVFYQIIQLTLQESSYPGALPWRLLCVSRHWFLTMIREPSLWSNIHLPWWYHDQRGVRVLTWRMRASYPLSVHLKCPLETFIPYSISTEGLNMERLVSLTLQYPVLKYHQLTGLPSQPFFVLPELLHLHIFLKVGMGRGPDALEPLEEDTGLVFLRNLRAPKLISLSYKGLCPSVGLPDEISETVSNLQITSYCLSQLDPHNNPASPHYRWHKKNWDSILQLPNLRHVHVDLGPFQGQLRRLDASDKQATTPPILMPNLETFTVTSSCIHSPPISAPKLQSLTVRKDKNANEDFGQLKEVAELMLSQSQFPSPELRFLDFADS
ncbi:hypothetical protein DL96DRAFT_1684521 [Flagelloscypha sp. PMI_526]|nr:hypothetical protein DL96DRAFT_1684521 [Flagelloscypha sp. PMI_526]